MQWNQNGSLPQVFMILLLSQKLQRGGPSTGVGEKIKQNFVKKSPPVQNEAATVGFMLTKYPADIIWKMWGHKYSQELLL